MKWRNSWQLDIIDYLYCILYFKSTNLFYSTKIIFIRSHISTSSLIVLYPLINMRQKKAFLFRAFFLWNYETRNELINTKNKKATFLKSRQIYAYSSRSDWSNSHFACYLYLVINLLVMLYSVRNQNH
jgi:hypothetical protein